MTYVQIEENELNSLKVDAEKWRKYSKKRQKIAQKTNKKYSQTKRSQAARKAWETKRKKAIDK